MLVKRKNVVVIGGGTGLPTLLQGLKLLENINIFTIVTVSDNGSSTGALTKYFNIPAVGDLRRVLGALAREREELEAIMEYRFKNTNTDLDGHALGNLIITSSILNKGDFAIGIEAVSKMLNVSGIVIPVANKYHILKAELNDGQILNGEVEVGKHSYGQIKRLFFEGCPDASQRALQAIAEADYIILGIGSLYTSLIANLIYHNMQTFLKATRAQVFYFANIFTQHGETDNMSLKDHIEAIETHTHRGFINKVIVADGKIPSTILKSYEKAQQQRLKIDYAPILKFNLIEISKPEVAKHGATKLAKAFRTLFK